MTRSFGFGDLHNLLVKRSLKGRLVRAIDENSRNNPFRKGINARNQLGVIWGQRVLQRT